MRSPRPRGPKSLLEENYGLSGGRHRLVMGRPVIPQFASRSALEGISSSVGVERTPDGPRLGTLIASTARY